MANTLGSSRIRQNNSIQFSRPGAPAIGRLWRLRAAVFMAAEALEARTLLSVNITTYHNDNFSTGVNSNETLLTPGNVFAANFAKQFSTAVDGQVYGQPLYVSNVNITTGAQQGLHNVVFVTTQHDSVYAIDADSGSMLWHDSFINGTSITTVPSGETGSGDITPEIGITATPVIDLSTNFIYVEAKTKEIVGGDTTHPHYVHRLHKINIQNGVDTSIIIAETIRNTSTGAYTYNSRPSPSNTAQDPFVFGGGDGSIQVTDTTVNPTVTTTRVYFNALRGMFRPGLVLHNGIVYLASASHGDNGPYHGWLLGYNATTLALTSVLNTTPNGGLGGIWQGGGITAVEDRNGQTYFYFETGNGTFNQTVSNFNAQSFPIDGNYGDSFVKAALDATSTRTSQNVNGWGMKVVDFFTPFNEQSLDIADTDLGSGAPVILPDSVGSAAHPHLLVGAGKEGKVYLIDRDNMGKYDPNTDKVVQPIANAINGSLGTPAFFNNKIYYNPGYGGQGKAFSIANGVINPTPSSLTPDSFGQLAATPSISADGTTNGIMWAIDRGSNQLRAYAASDLATEIYTTAQAGGNRDQLGTVVKFTVPTVAAGRVYVGTSNAIVAYGPPLPPTTIPADPSNLVATSPFPSQVDLTWNDNATNEAIYKIERSPDGINGWQQIATVGVNFTNYSDTTVQALTTYFYRVRANNALGDSTNYSNIASATTSANPIAGTGDGLRGQYYDNQDFTNLKVDRVDATVNFNWGAGSPDPLIGNNTFSVRWTGIVQAQFSQTYTFYTQSDDGVRLFINNQSVIDNFTDHSSIENSGTFPMTAGQAYTVRMEYYENGGDAVAQLRWSSPSTPKAIIPKSQLFSGTAPIAPSGLTATATSGTTVDLHWTDNSSNETGFKIERKQGAGGTYALAGQVGPDVHTFSDSMLNNNTTYFYRVRAANFGTDSANSNEASVTLPVPPLTPSGAHATLVTKTRIDFAWNDNSNNEDAFRIYRKTGTSGTFILIATLPPNSNSYSDTGPNGLGLTPGTEYDYHIQAGNIAGYSDFTGFTATTLPDVNNPPTITSLSDSIDPVVEGNTFVLTANGVADSDGAVANMKFFREFNGQAGLQTGIDPDLLLAMDTNGADGWSTTVSTANLLAGTYTYYAQATDDQNGTSPSGSSAATTLNTIQVPSVAGLMLDMRVQGGAKAVEVGQVGQTITLELYARARGANGSFNDEAFQSIQGSIRSVQGSSQVQSFFGHFVPDGDQIFDDNTGELIGNFVGLSPFANSGTQNGAEQDLIPEDGSNDFGANPVDVIGIGDFLAIRSAAMQTTQGSTSTIAGANAGREWLIGRVQWVVQGLAGPGGTTEINFNPRQTSTGLIINSAALWKQDGIGLNGLTGIVSVGAPVVVSLDITAPLAPSAPDLAPASDSGVSNSDNLTNSLTPTFTGTAEAGSTITIFANGMQIGSGIATGGNYSISTGGISPGQNTVTARATDGAGNVSPPSAPLIITVDTTIAAPSTPDMTNATDSGASNSDNITNVTSPIFTGKAEAGSSVTLYSDGDLIGSAVAAGGDFSITSSALADGQHVITAVAVDQAGNVSVASSELAITIDTLISAPFNLDLLFLSDHGISDTDNLTDETKPTFSGNAEAGGTVTVYADGVAVGSTVATGGVFSVSTSVLTAGTHSITAAVVDLAGNPSGASPPLSVTIDPAAPTAAIAAVAPDPRHTSVAAISISFGKEVYDFGIDDLLLVRDDFGIPLDSATLNTGDNKTFTLANLAPLTDRAGTYSLYVVSTTSGIRSLAGAAMSGFAEESWAMLDINGTANADIIRLAPNSDDPTLTDVFINDATALYSFIPTNLPQIFINGLGADDTLNLDFSNGSPLPVGGAVYDGGGATNTLMVTGGTGADAATLSATTLGLNNVPIAYSNVVLSRVNGGAGTDSLIANGGHVVSDQIETITGNNNAIIDFESTQALSSLTLNDIARANEISDGGHVLVTSALSIGLSATLDLFNNDLIVKAAPGGGPATLAALTALLARGRNSGAYWAGAGISSSAAAADPGRFTSLAVALNGLDGGVLYPSFDGQSVNSDAVLVKYSWNGDTDLNGVDDADDYFRIDSGFANAGSTYFDGDFDFSGGVDADDYFLIDSAFANQNAVLSGPAAAADAPVKRTRRPHHQTRAIRAPERTGQASIRR